MVQRDRRLLQVLIGVVCALLIVDVLALIFVVAPLRASQQARAHTADLTAQLTRSTLDSALILPTRDPHKPRITRTPLPTITPWLILAATPSPAAPAIQAPTNVPAPGTRPDVLDAAGAASAPTAMAVRPPAMLQPTVTSSGGRAAPGASHPTSTSPAPVALGGTPVTLAGTPAAVAARPTATSGPPTSTASPTRPPATPQPPPTITAGDAAQFQVYVQDQYNTIVGQQIDILAVTFDAVEAELGLPKVTVYVAGDDTETGFAAQNVKDVADYGHRLLDDVKRFFDGQSCAVAVVSKYDTRYPDACRNNPTWCTVNAQDQLNNIWNITWTYVLATSVDGTDSVQIRS